jgi:hypothetical protein
VGRYPGLRGQPIDRGFPIVDVFAKYPGFYNLIRVVMARVVGGDISSLGDFAKISS